MECFRRSIIGLAVGSALLAVAPLAARPLTEEELQAVTAPVRERLIDPFSVRFEIPEILDGDDGFCARYNPKNSLGGHIGWALYFGDLKFNDTHHIAGFERTAILDNNTYTVEAWTDCRGSRAVQTFQPD